MVCGGLPLDFAGQIELLLSQATRQGLYFMAGGAMGTAIVDIKAYVGDRRAQTFVATTEKVKVLSEPARLLERLYASTSPTDRDQLVGTFVRAINLDNARVIARTLAATGNLTALSTFPFDERLSEELWRGLIHVLRYESLLFTEADLQTVEAAARGLNIQANEVGARETQDTTRSSRYRLVAVTTGRGNMRTYEFSSPIHDMLHELRAVLARIRYLRLAKTIREGRNPSIDADRQTLLSRLQAMGFSETLSSASDEIEARAVVAVTETDIKTVMDLLRTFYEEFTEEACHKVEAKVGRAAPSGPKVNHYSPYREYLESGGFIGREESELLQKLYNFLSNQGSHKLGSAPEQLHVAYATVIEWCMLIAGRIRSFLA
jgi:hypothetical protein